MRGLRRTLWGAIAVLMAVTALEWVWPNGGPATGAVPRPRPVSRAHAPDIAARDTSAWVSAVLARPVFSISRRPPRGVTSKSNPLAAGQARLSGIMITRLGRFAIFAPEGGGHALVLAEGAAVNESTIRRIQPDRVVMASGAVLLPAYDRNRVAVSGAPTFQPPPSFPSPGFPPPGFNPGFPNANNPNPGLPNAGMPGVFPNANFTPVVPQPGADDAGQPPIPLPQMLRGNMIPQRRE